MNNAHAMVFEPSPEPSGAPSSYSHLRPMRLSYDPTLIEEAVLLAERTLPADGARAFRRERDRIYAIGDAEQREARFRALHQRWFLRLGLGRAVEQALAERPEVPSALAEGRVVRALARAQEGADLVDRVRPGATDPHPTLLLRIRPDSLVAGDRLLPLLRHELLHVADMLDPAFGYQRVLPAAAADPACETILRDRYRVLWDVTIDGRLTRAGLGGEELRAARWREFAATFPMLGERCREAFEVWFARRQPTHRAIVSFLQQL